MGFTGLQIGKTALQAASVGINTVGHNIANANTSGYSRQVVSNSAGQSLATGKIICGNGVSVSHVTRVVDLYYLRMERMSNNSFSYYNGTEKGYSALESFFGELSDNDLSSALNSFWKAINDLNSDVSNDALRQQFITQAQALCATFNALDSDLVQAQMQLNSDVSQSVTSINSMCRQIAELNQEIMKAEAGGASANDLRDKRDRLVNDLGGIVDITVNEDSTGAYNIYNGNNALVYRTANNELEVITEYRDELMYTMPVFSKGKVAIESDGGALGGQLALRDAIIPGYKNELDTLAAQMMWQMNILSSQGSGLAGYSEITASSKIADPAQSLSNLDYGFTPVAGTFQIIDGSFELKVFNTETGQEDVLLINITLDSDPETANTILYDSVNPDAENSLLNMMQNALDQSVSGAFSVSLNQYNQIQVTANTNQYTLGFGRDTSGTLAALGLNTLFAGHDAATADVNPQVADNTALLSTGDTLGEAGSQTVTAYIALRTSLTMNGGRQTFEEHYQAMIVRLGNESSTASTMRESKHDQYLSAQNLALGVSGVDLDEEAAKLIAYKSAYEAAANFISVLNECYQSVLDM